MYHLRIQHPRSQTFMGVALALQTLTLLCCLTICKLVAFNLLLQYKHNDMVKSKLVIKSWKSKVRIISYTNGYLMFNSLIVVSINMGVWPFFFSTVKTAGRGSSLRAGWCFHIRMVATDRLRFSFTAKLWKI